MTNIKGAVTGVGWGVYVTLAFASLLGVGWADGASNQALPPAYQPAAAPRFRTAATPRTYAVGPEVAVFGGLDVNQAGDYDGSIVGLAGTQKFSQVSHVGTLFGVKAGFTWPGFTMDTTQLDAEATGWHWLPSVEYEFFYLSKEIDGKVGGLANVQANLDSYVLSINPILRAQWGIFRPYAGIGLGGAYLEATSPRVTSPLLPGVSVQDNSRTDSLAFVGQLIVGSDVFLSRNVSLFGEYKFVNFVGQDFKGAALEFKAKDVTSDQVLALGVRYHF